MFYYSEKQMLISLNFIKYHIRRVEYICVIFITDSCSLHERNYNRTPSATELLLTFEMKKEEQEATCGEVCNKFLTAPPNENLMLVRN